MDSLKQVKDFLRDLISPIVEEAVKASVAVPEAPRAKKYLTVKEVEEQYSVSTSTIYQRFKEGKLTRVKNGGKTYILTDEIEGSLIRKSLAGHVKPMRCIHK